MAGAEVLSHSALVVRIDWASGCHVEWNRREEGGRRGARRVGCWKSGEGSTGVVAGSSQRRGSSGRAEKVWSGEYGGVLVNIISVMRLSLNPHKTTPRTVAARIVRATPLNDHSLHSPSAGSKPRRVTPASAEKWNLFHGGPERPASSATLRVSPERRSALVYLGTRVAIGR